jgi:phosphate transport system permease protein
MRKNLIDLHRRKGRYGKEHAIQAGLFLCAFLSVLTTAGIIIILFRESASFFEAVPWVEFATGTEWTPLFDPPRFGVLPLVCGTLLVALGAALVSIPLGLGTAFFLSQYASHGVRDILKPILEVLAGIPTVVYGYFALTFITPVLQSVFPSTQIFNAASAAIAIGFMILPMVASLCDDAMRAVPESLKQAGYAMGATRFEVATRIVFPAALSGVLASFILAISRAIGETMVVALAAGGTPRLTWNPLESVQTMTAFIVQVSLGDTPVGTISYQTIFAVGFVLFLMTLLMNLLAHRIVRKFSEVYE